MFFFPIAPGDEELQAVGDLSRKHRRAQKTWLSSMPRLEQLYLGFKHFRCQGEANPDIFSDDELSGFRCLPCC